MNFFKIFALFLLTLSVAAQADIKAGPIGGVAGSPFEEYMGNYERICTILVNSKETRIYGLQFEFCDNSGKRRLSKRYGKGSGELSTLSLAADEVIEKINITKLPVNDLTRIVGLQFVTNKSKWLTVGQIGISTNDGRVTWNGSFYENLNLPAGYEVHGFFGSAGAEIDALGVLYRKIPGSNLQGKTGIFGNVGGGEKSKSFSDYARSFAPYHERICGIKVHHGARIDAIQVEICGLNGVTTFKPKHGGNKGSESYFKLYDYEYLVAIKGWIGYKSVTARVFGLQFITNTGRVSPVYGKQTRDPFELNVPEGYVINDITGATVKELDAIGIGFTLLN
jgi:hypothetical protein